MENGVEVNNYPIQEDTPKKSNTKVKQLPQDIVDYILDALADEYTAHYFYMCASNWCNNEGYFKAGSFFGKESLSELEHAKGLQDYLVQWNVMPVIPKVETNHDVDNLYDVLKKSYDLEYSLFVKYNDISKKILVKDPSTFDFLKTYRDIQNRSVAEYSDLINVVEKLNTNNMYEMLYFENNYFLE